MRSKQSRTGLRGLEGTLRVHIRCKNRRVEIDESRPAIGLRAAAGCDVYSRRWATFGLSIVVHVRGLRGKRFLEVI